MDFHSTRGAPERIGFSTALLRGLAPDGGLYVPQEWPRQDAEQFPQELALPAVGMQLVAPFAAGDRLAPSLSDIVTEAFSFRAPVVPIRGAAARDSSPRVSSACARREIRC